MQQSVSVFSKCSQIRKLDGRLCRRESGTAVSRFAERFRRASPGIRSLSRRIYRSNGAIHIGDNGITELSAIVVSDWIHLSGRTTVVADAAADHVDKS